MTLARGSLGPRPCLPTIPDQWRDVHGVKLVWVNSPSNPTGAVATREQLARIVAAARDIGALVFSDECYAELTWEGGECAVDP